MDFMLTYRGYVPSGSNLKDVHAIREALHLQLKNLPEEGRAHGARYPHSSEEYEQGGLDQHQWLFWKVGGYEYVPLVQRQHQLLCQLDILWLRSQRAGTVNGSDLDNCLKRITDGLTMPKANQMTGITPPDDPATRRRYCLLQDDSMVNGFSVKAFRSLEDVPDVSQVRDMSPREKPSAKVHLLIHVTLQTPGSSWIGAGGSVW